MPYYSYSINHVELPYYSCEIYTSPKNKTSRYFEQ